MAEGTTVNPISITQRLCSFLGFPTECGLAVALGQRRLDTETGALGPADTLGHSDEDDRSCLTSSKVISPPALSEGRIFLLWKVDAGTDGACWWMS